MPRVGGDHSDHIHDTTVNESFRGTPPPIPVSRYRVTTPRVGGNGGGRRKVVPAPTRAFSGASQPYERLKKTPSSLIRPIPIRLPSTSSSTNS